MKYESFSTRCSKVISKVKVSERRRELQNDRQDKNNMPPDLRSRGHKNCSLNQATCMLENKVSDMIHFKH